MPEVSDPVRCSDGSQAVDEPLAGTAPHAAAWVALEQSGPWGPKAFTSSHLDVALGAAIESTAEPFGIRPALIRRPGKHAVSSSPVGADPRRVLVASTAPTNCWLLAGVVDSPARVLDLDWAAVAAGDQEKVRRSLRSLRSAPRSQLLVCTNGRRDVCCAVKGRPVALGAAAELPGRVWEVTHTSGHRFAPTTVLLPSGTLHGRVSVSQAVALVRSADRGATVLGGSRGRSTWEGAAQAAELAVRQETGELSLSALTVSAHGRTEANGQGAAAELEGRHAWETTIDHVDGRSWSVATSAVESTALRAESCGKALGPLTYVTAVVSGQRAGADRKASRGPSGDP